MSKKRIAYDAVTFLAIISLSLYMHWYFFLFSYLTMCTICGYVIMIRFMIVIRKLKYIENNLEESP